MDTKKGEGCQCRDGLRYGRRGHHPTSATKNYQASGCLNIRNPGGCPKVTLRKTQADNDALQQDTCCPGAAHAGSRCPPRRCPGQRHTTPATNNSPQTALCTALQANLCTQTRRAQRCSRTPNTPPNICSS
jgi:hypothetical protein